MRQLLDTVQDVQRLCNRDLTVLGVLPTMYDARTNLARRTLADVEERYGSDRDPAAYHQVRALRGGVVGRAQRSGHGIELSRCTGLSQVAQRIAAVRREPRAAPQQRPKPGTFDRIPQ